ncbi:oligopeptide ABC transporter substrate-binding protein [Jeotgalibacillus sp. R-1-5s-1]|uniref:oligopeptide ABC transporter substrate-binding protein n=1 Tax=Jeotgalibacillus sp. R-1-5s-1 TaxID=2555897 RepID=UPI00106CFBD6|nr:oligopeptide ABC transporter substrate-binding protein [Jeotgalibacillus sp. R-1-5s-1]TFD97606.1 oligopeptide ABC transporter substrate-binding protein [Jeotgalibacillus sp. R-1-5s-1]
MKKKSLLLMLAMLLILSAFLAACSSDNAEPAETDNETETEDGTAGEAQSGGTLTYGFETAPEGLFNPAFYGIATDAEVLALFDEALITYDENLQPEPGIASWETEDNKVFTFTFEQGVMWHDGVELTVNDWVFALETIASPDYDGQRYSNVQTIEGAEAFRNGEADSISGLNVIDDYTIEITFDQARVNNLVNVWSYPMSRAQFEGIPVAEMSASEQVRTKPVGLGPFKVTNVIPGEAVEMVKFEDYWRGEPKLDGINIRVLDSSTIVGALGQGDIDMVTLAPVNAPEVEELDNVEVITAPGLTYYYIGFKLGTFNNETKEITEDKEKYADLNLRKAMAHAIDRQAWVDAFFFGYGKPIDGPVPSNHWIAADSADLETYDYDPERAKELLEEAGYVDVDGDGFVEDPNGEPFVAKFSHYATGNPTFETRAQAIVQYWQEVGINAELEMTEVNLYYEMIEKDDPAMETFFGGWGTGADPDPTALWGSDQLWNYPRFKNEESDKLLADALNVDVVGTDEELRKDLYVQWQQLVASEVPMIFIAELDEIWGLSDRVENVTFDVSGYNNPYEWSLAQ